MVDYSTTQLITWLNGRLTGKLTVIHGNKKHTIWTNKWAVRDGLTIEDAINNFVNEHKINVKKEIGE